MVTAESEFIVPYWKFLKSFNHPFCVRMGYTIQYRRSVPFNNRIKNLVFTISIEF
jgi:hypothetical protein